MLLFIVIFYFIVFERIVDKSIDNINNRCRDRDYNEVVYYCYYCCVEVSFVY